MRKLYIFGLIALAGIIIGLAWAEQLSLTTYYPAPYGVYREFTTTGDTCLARDSGNVGIGTTVPGANLEINNTLRLTPVSSPDYDIEGGIYYDNDEDIVKYHNGNNWMPMGGGGGWVFDETFYPNRDIPEASWYDLDLSSKVGNKSTLVLLKVGNDGGVKGAGFQRGIIAKPYNDPDDFAVDAAGALNQAHLVSHGYYKFIMTPTDNNGHIGLRSTAFGTVQWDIKLVGYIK